MTTLELSIPLLTVAAYILGRIHQAKRQSPVITEDVLRDEAPS